MHSTTAKIYARGTSDEVVSGTLLAEVFGVEARVERTERGPRITPLRAVHPTEMENASD